MDEDSLPVVIVMHALLWTFTGGFGNFLFRGARKDWSKGKILLGMAGWFVIGAVLLAVLGHLA